MNKNKICTILYLTAGICFFLSAILGFLNKNGSIGGGLTDLALGATFTCLSVVWYRQWKKEIGKDENEKKTNSNLR